MAELRKKLKKRTPEHGERSLMGAEMARSGEEESAEAEPEPTTQPIVESYKTPSPIHSFAELTAATLPAGVNPLQKEEWLNPTEFEKAFGVSREAFLKIPKWKRDQQKKQAGLW